MTKREQRGIRIEAVLTLIAVILAFSVTYLSCDFLAPRVNDLFSVFYATLFVTVIFINAFGACAILLLLPWHLIKNHMEKINRNSDTHIARGNQVLAQS